ncbi:hypothetical protein CBL_07712 [Carabus blaptoides fortunei]
MKLPMFRPRVQEPVAICKFNVTWLILIRDGLARDPRGFSGGWKSRAERSSASYLSFTAIRVVAIIAGRSGGSYEDTSREIRLGYTAGNCERRQIELQDGVGKSNSERKGETVNGRQWEDDSVYNGQYDGR